MFASETVIHWRARHLQVALVTSVGLDLGTTLIFSGLYNIYSGAAFGVPIPVQPMKSIAAVAITEDGITLEQTLLAGFLVSTVVFTLGATKLIDAANRLVHESVIRGIQVGIGLKLAIKGADLIMFRATTPAAQWRPWLGAQGLLLGLVAAVYVLFAVVKFKPGDTDVVGASCCDVAVPHGHVPANQAGLPTTSNTASSLRGLLSTTSAPTATPTSDDSGQPQACDPDHNDACRAGLLGNTAPASAAQAQRESQTADLPPGLTCIPRGMADTLRSGGWGPPVAAQRAQRASSSAKVSTRDSGRHLEHSVPGELHNSDTGDVTSAGSGLLEDSVSAA